ncbi:ABC-type sugar transport system permease subunit [Paenibacillus cellulosilyticus]|uniref:ABC-type sugar transport system permease subunit n=1 Tax=Paenibacillus cellulosilyticus TaxID=375489 RepID=A0A2V2Z075_9BACL|nr:sugar ABC transporter permease [Paenibacillus cellulosilyticus]PWW07447.1 ABC-type sugar transport system permease subunit [Paenibacillus cellulosilyticus]QKS44394.1 sugar ABC transporter permease [Paenibacillus cellulosilyticus]
MKMPPMTLKRRRSILGFAFVSPWLIGFIFLFAVPLIQSIKFSFTKLELVPGGFTLKSVGWGNFNNALFVDANFNRQLTESVINMLVNVPLILFFSLFCATLLNQKFRGRALARAMFFLPVILASGAVAAAEAQGLISLIGDSTTAEQMEGASAMFNTLPLVDTLLEGGAPMWAVDYLINAVDRIYEIITASGVQILIFLAALQSIPGSMYEVAKIEGATSYETFWKITFPMVSPLILTNVIYTIIDSFTDSTVTRTIVKTAFTSQNFGLSAAMSWLYTLVAALLLFVIGYLISKKVFYYN